MLAIQHCSREELQRIRIACAYLFSPELAKQDAFLRDLRGNALRDAFREKAKRYHPDLHRNEPEDTILKRRDRFIKIRASFEFLKGRIVEEVGPSRPESEAHRAKVIAVGGAKGGIGKSIFAVNLGVTLSSLGKRTVMVDLDLGGANLHLYLGETAVARNINDFLGNRVQSLREIESPTRYGPRLIGGDSSQLGAANIGFLRKLKLIKAIRELQADYVVLDLGGDTSYNIIDFFLAADCGLVLTTCDPASYLEAYNFIKVALYRKLNRIFGAESSLGWKKNPALQRLIQEATLGSNGNRVRDMEGLLEKIRKEHPRYLPGIEEILKDFRPGIVVNMISKETNEASVIQRIQEVSTRMLSIEVVHLGNLPYQKQVKRSAVNLVPVVSRHRTGVVARTIEEISRRIAMS
ncbi:MAG: P-loop NTPase [Deltaproteobacteria bacterium]|nr:P-loop NTPase [Deltaproteobacteria bacterium]